MYLEDTSFYELSELSSEWEACSGKLKRWLISGVLKPHVWLPVLIVLKRCRLADAPAEVTQNDYDHYEGFIPLNGQHCQRMYRLGQLSLRDFRSGCGDYHYQLPDSSDDILIKPEDLIILDEDKQRFEQKHLAAKDLEQVFDPEFRIVEVDGIAYRFGEMQSAILRRLHAAAIDGEPWQNGKKLLHAVGSESFSLSNVFKHKPVWRKLVQSDSRGHYRISPEILKNVP